MLKMVEQQDGIGVLDEYRATLIVLGGLPLHEIEIHFHLFRPWSFGFFPYITSLRSHIYNVIDHIVQHRFDCRPPDLFSLFCYLQTTVGVCYQQLEIQLDWTMGTQPSMRLSYTGPLLIWLEPEATNQPINSLT